MAQQDMVLWKDLQPFPAGTLDQCTFIDLSAMAVNVTCDAGTYSLEMGLFGVAYSVVLGHPTEQEIMDGSSIVCSSSPCWWDNYSFKLLLLP